MRIETKNADPAPDDMKGLITGLGTAFEEFKKRHDQELLEVKKGIKAAPADLTKLEEALDKMQTAKDALDAKNAAAAKAQQDRIDALEAKLNRPGLGHNGGPLLDAEKDLKSFNNLAMSHNGALKRAMPGPIEADQYNLYRKGFLNFLRGGDRRIEEDERKAMIVGSDPDGGYLVQADVTGRIITRIYETSPMRQIVSVQAISTDALEGMIDTDEAGGLLMLGEQNAPSETSTPKLGKWRIPVWEGAVEPRATQQMIEDAAVDVEAWLARKVADKIARGQNTMFINGDGVSRPRGLVTYPTAVTPDETRQYGTFQHVNTGVNSNFALPANGPADVFFDLIGAFKDAYLQNARFLTRREVITLTRKFKESTTGNYLWQPGLQAGQPQSILTYPVTIAQDMPALGAGSLSLAFGDFAETYQIVDRLGFTTIRDNLTTKPFVKFYTRTRFGGGAISFEAMKFIRFGT
jgi:HK97 family phage major capsid protein